MSACAYSCLADFHLAKDPGSRKLFVFVVQRRLFRALGLKVAGVGVKGRECRLMVY